MSVSNRSSGLAAACLALCMLASPAAAGSVQRIDGQATGASPSIQTITCPHCTLTVQSDERTPDYVVPDIPPGTQNIEIRTIDGKQVLVRREAWQGGSPVTFISRLESNVVAAIAQNGGQPVAAAAPASDETTGAVETPPAAEPVPPVLPTETDLRLE